MVAAACWATRSCPSALPDNASILMNFSSSGGRTGFSDGKGGRGTGRGSLGSQTAAASGGAPGDWPGLYVPLSLMPAPEHLAIGRADVFLLVFLICSVLYRLWFTELMGSLFHGRLR